MMRAKKSLGQNFLQDASVIDRIVDALELSLDDIVLEIGPGRGALTEKLVERSGKVIAIEFDRDMVALLRERFDHSLQIVQADVLNVDLSDLGADKVVGNLPYNISTAIVQRLVDVRAVFSTLVLMFQREVVDRITAKPGSAERGYLTLLVESAFEVERVAEVEPSAFRPQPKVWSSVIKLTPKPQSLLDEASFRRLLSTAFTHKRKTLLNNLKTDDAAATVLLREAGIDGGRRAETLTVEEWLKLATILATRKAGDQ